MNALAFPDHCTTHFGKEDSGPCPGRGGSFVLGLPQGHRRSGSALGRTTLVSLTGDRVSGNLTTPPVSSMMVSRVLVLRFMLFQPGSLRGRGVWRLRWTSLLGNRKTRLCWVASQLRKQILGLSLPSPALVAPCAWNRLRRSLPFRGRISGKLWPPSFAREQHFRAWPPW